MRSTLAVNLGLVIFAASGVCSVLDWLSGGSVGARLLVAAHLSANLLGKPGVAIVHKGRTTMTEDFRGRALRIMAVIISIAVAGCASSSGEDDPEVRKRLALEEWRNTCEAAVAGDAEAQKWMAEYYRYGYLPVQQDRVKAYLWYEHAERGLPPGNLKRVETGMEMTLDELAEAKRLAATWAPENQSCDGEPSQHRPKARPSQPAPLPRPKP